MQYFPDFNDEMNQTISEIIYHDFQYIFENESIEDSELYDSIEEFVDKNIENYFVYSHSNFFQALFPGFRPTFFLKNFD